MKAWARIPHASAYPGPLNGRGVKHQVGQALELDERADGEVRSALVASAMADASRSAPSRTSWVRASTAVRSSRAPLPSSTWSPVRDVSPAGAVTCPALPPLRAWTNEV